MKNDHGACVFPLRRPASGRYVIYDEIHEHRGPSPFDNWEPARTAFLSLLMGTSPMLTLQRQAALRQRIAAIPVTC